MGVEQIQRHGERQVAVDQPASSALGRLVVVSLFRGATVVAAAAVVRVARVALTGVRARPVTALRVVLIVWAVELVLAAPEIPMVVMAEEAPTARAAAAAVTAMGRRTARAGRAERDKNIRLTPEPIQGNRLAPVVVAAAAAVPPPWHLGMVG
jgi:hypothetical protein